MSSPDAIDGRFHGIVRELKASRPKPPAELRARVLQAAAEAAQPRPRPGWRLPQRRLTIALAPALVLALAAGIAGGIVASRSDGPAPTALVQRALAPKERSSTDSTTLRGQAVAPAAGRAQRYEAELALRVRDVSRAMQRALRLTRSLEGFVRSVDYGEGERAGRADLVVRIPVDRVQEAIVRFSALGEIASQRVSIRDLQPALDRRFRRMQALRAEIARLSRQIAARSADTPERRALQAKVVRLRSGLVSLRREQARLRRQASFATVSLAVERAHEAQVAPGRLGRTLGEVGDALVQELVVVLYGIGLGGPLLALAAIGLLAGSSARRRSAARVLERS